MHCLLTSIVGAHGRRCRAIFPARAPLPFPNVIPGNPSAEPKVPSEAKGFRIFGFATRNPYEGTY